MKKILLLTLSCLVCGIIIGLSFNASAQESTSIPSWVKNTAKFWVNGDVGDTDFIKAIQWMVTQGIIVLPNNSSPASNTQQTPSVNSNSQITTSELTHNPLSVLLPTSQELGALWKIHDPTIPTIFSDIAPSKPVLNIKGQTIAANQDQPTNIIEQSFEKASTPLTVSEFKIDIASFGPVGSLSFSDIGNTRSLYSKVIADYQNNHNGYKSTVFVPTPTDNTVTCSMYTIGTAQPVPQQTTSYNMFCIKNTVLFMINVQGTDIGMTDDLKSITNNILKKIT